jgi:ParB-like chromosome segregation protein Spo0J
MEIKSKEIKIVDIDSIIPNNKNNNIHNDEQKTQLKKIIRRSGFRSPLTVSNRSGFLVKGHLRLEAAKELGMKEVPVIFQDYENEAEEFADLTADNAIAKQSKLDLSLINEQILDFGPELDIELLGIKDFTIEPLEKFEMEDELRDDMNKKFILEITFPNDMEMMDIHDDLTSRGYIVKIK